MQTIWRVENNEGKGCYRYKNTKKFLEYHDLENNQKNHPCPLFDTGIDRDLFNKEICGFYSIEQAMRWFSVDDLINLKTLGFRLKKVFVKEITAIGNSQILAKK